MPTAARPRTRTGAAWQAVVVGASFAMLLAGTNAINPLMPVYRERLGLDPLLIASTFFWYVVMLGVLLLALARPRVARHAPVLLVAAIAAGIGADALLAIATEWSILAGRVVTGVAGGLGTGAAATLVVAAIGARGRAISATGNLVGAVVGTAGAQLVVSLAEPISPQAVALGHACVLAILLVAAIVVLRLRRAANRAAVADALPGAAPVRLDRRAAPLLVTGAIAWVGLSVAISFGSTVFAELEQPVARALGPVLMLVASAAAQLGSPTIARFAPWASGTLVLAIGAGCVAAGATLAWLPLVLAGFVLLGFGVGIASRTALVALTCGATPAQQGTLSSLYAAISYAAAAVAVLLVGWIGNLTGAVASVVGACVVVALASIVATLWAPRLRDTVEAPALR